MKWNKNDNSFLSGKVFIRKRYLELLKEPRILDLFCGEGHMYNQVYRPAGVEYFGVDNVKIHDKNLCILHDNYRFVREANISQYNYFDLDHYGCPWKLFYYICKRYQGKEMVCIITDGLLQKLKIDFRPIKMVSATQRIPDKMKIPGIYYWYKDMFATMLKDIEKRYGFKTSKAECLYNKRKSVSYWGLYLKK